MSTSRKSDRDLWKTFHEIPGGGHARVSQTQRLAARQASRSTRSQIDNCQKHSIKFRGRRACPRVTGPRQRGGQAAPLPEVARDREAARALLILSEIAGQDAPQADELCGGVRDTAIGLKAKGLHLF